MTGEEFDRLTAACDTVLGPAPSVERHAIAWLHVLSEHPSIVPRYDALFAPRRPFTLNAVRSLAGQLKGLGSGANGADPDELPDHADVLFISHVLNDGQVGAEDFYFGRAPEALREAGFSPLVVFANWTSHGARGLGARWGDGMAKRWSLRASLSPAAELRMRLRLQREARRIRRERRAVSDPFLRRVYEEAARNALTGTSLFNLRHREQVAALVQRYRPTAVFATYEGHAWERLAFRAAREANPQVRCIGYHHTILFQKTHAVLRPQGKALDPDVILTAGAVTERAFRRVYQSAGVPVRTMGIHRRPPDSGSRPARFETRARTCLVVPDGLPSEAVLMFEFAIAAARARPDVTFILRLHPILSFAELQAANPGLQDLPANVKLSSQPLAADFEASRWILYRGSNTTIYGVMAGLRPYYLWRDGELAIDCLHELQTWKRVVSSTGEFLAGLDADDGGLSAAERDGQEAAMTYCAEFFQPVRPEVAIEAARGS